MKKSKKENKSKTLDITKDNGKFLITISICIILIMVMFYFGSNASKQTFSADTCPSGYTSVGSKCCSESAKKSITSSQTFSSQIIAAQTCNNDFTSNYSSDGASLSCDATQDGSGYKYIMSFYKVSECASSCSSGYHWYNDSCQACPKGSYGGGGYITYCSACPAGKTTSGTGSTSSDACSVSCSNSLGVDTWQYPGATHTDKVSNLCTIATCKSGYRLSNNTCVANTDTISLPRPSCSDITYSGAQQILVAKNNGYTVTYNGGTSIPVNAGTYTTVVTLASGYEWSDGSTSPVTLSCKINKYPTVSIPAMSINVGATGTDTISVKTIGKCNGILTATSGDSSKLEITSGSSTTIAVSSNVETRVDSAVVGLKGKASGSVKLSANFVPTDSSNCNSKGAERGIILLNTTSACQVNVTMPKEVELGAEFEASATITNNGSSTSYTLKSGESIDWSCGGLAYAGMDAITTNKKYKIRTYSYQDANNVTCSVSVKNSNGTVCSSSGTTRVGASEYDPVKNTITFKNGNDVVATKYCTVNSKGLCQETGTNTISTPIPPTRSGYYFHGWGSTANCTSGGYGSNVEILGTNGSAVYYACFNTKAPDEESDKDFDKTLCSYSQFVNVIYDTRYLNCQRTNISYKNQASRTRGNVKACCLAKGYTWVGENFDSGVGGEYCIVCGSGSKTTCDDSANGKYTTEAKARTEANKSCTAGSTINVSKESNGCYKYTCSSVTTCDDSANGKFSTEAKAKAAGDKSCAAGSTISVSKESNNCYKYTCSRKSSSKKPSGSTEIIVNPPTGNALIMVVWAIGALMIGYSIWYFMNRKDNN